ncbi:hypothetical protein BJ322DRAFT_1017356 [Thelephora terrestris]|uniref:Uncharacterized protein n=1 Tax=Thelephora terrestris TaxID=56493 RepID=A0A9P6HMB0_9AGAM|nr:hypothetical protein BJ322DRAFT_1017356 [Thelephora terrestris]
MEATSQCPHCLDFFKPRGITVHKKSCLQKKQSAEDQARFMADQRLRRQDSARVPDIPAPHETDADAHIGSSSMGVAPELENLPCPPLSLPMIETHSDHCDLDDRSGSGADSRNTNDAGANLRNANDAGASSHNMNDVGGLGANSRDANDASGSDGAIKVEYHPNSNREPKTSTFKEFKKKAAKADSTRLPDPEPWVPFKTQEDFEFATLTQDARMSKKQVNKLIDIFQRCIDKGKGTFTFSSHKEMKDTLTLAAERLPKFEKQTASAIYKGKTHEFDIWVRPIWMWIEDMLQNQDLIQHFEWDACHVSKFDAKSNSWVRVYDEPWTGDCQGHSTPTTTSALSRLRRVVRGHYKSGRNPKEKPNLNRTSFGLTDKGLSLQQD